MDESWKESLNELMARVRLVAEKYRELEEEGKQLNRENRELREKVRHTEQELNEVKNKYGTLKIAKSLLASSEDKHDARIKVNKMVREIDKCIALLNR